MSDVGLSHARKDTWPALEPTVTDDRGGSTSHFAPLTEHAEKTPRPTKGMRFTDCFPRA